MRALIIIPLLLIFPCILPAQNPLRSNHSFTVNLIGIDYGYEQRLKSDLSLIARVGLGNSEVLIFERYGYMYDIPPCSNQEQKLNRGDVYNLSPAFSIEPRIYYNTVKRISLGKRTAYNSFNFISIEFKGFLDPINRDYDTYYPFRISPMWGMRRVYNNILLFELNAGVNLCRTKYSEYEWGPKLNARFGIVF